MKEHIGRANDEMVEGFRDGYDMSAPEPSVNRSHSYRHGFANGRDDRSGKPRASYVELTRQPLTDFENAEKERVAGHERALEELVSFGVIPAGWPSGHIATRIEEFETCDLRARDWQVDFKQRASDAFAEVGDMLRNAYTVAVNREAQEAEFARLKAEEAERQRLEAIEAQRMREKEIARAAAERATREAEAKAAREAEEARQAVQRAEEQAAAEATAKARAANVAHRKAVNNEAMIDLVAAMAEVHTGNAAEANEIAKAIITAVAKGSVPHMRMEY